ncbi:MAG TPA: hypothetical protein VFZ42_00785 [Chitinophagaceae bacterium]
MKKALRFSLYLLTVVAVFTACRKEDNSKLPGLVRFPLPKITKVAGSSQNISAADPGAFNAKYTVDLYFPEDTGPQKFDIVVIKNGNKGVVKSLQENVATFPTELSLTASQLTTLFGAPIVAGDTYDISADVTLADGTKYEAFPVTGNAYASGIAAQPGASTQIRYTAN